MSIDAEKRPEKASRASFVQRIGEFVEQIDYQRMASPEQLEQVYRLRYEAYRREQFIDENHEKLCQDPFDFTDNHAIYGLFLGGELISSIRIQVLDKHHRESPSTLVYSDKLDPLLDQNKIMIDPSRFTANHEASLKYKALPYATLRVAAMASQYYNADYCLSCIRPEHAAFYKRVSRSEQMGEIRYFPNMNFQVVLYAAFKSTREDVWRRYPFFRAKAGEDERLFGTREKFTLEVETKYRESAVGL